MGKQIATILFREDYGHVERAIRQLGEVCFLPVRGHSAERLATVATLALSPDDIGKVGLTIYLVRPPDMKYVKTLKVPSLETYAISPASPRVVEFSRSYFDGTVLREGRLYVDTSGSADEQGKLFLQWAKELMDRVRKVLHREEGADYPVYVGSRARQWMAETGVTWSGRKELLLPSANGP